MIQELIEKYLENASTDAKDQLNSFIINNIDLELEEIENLIEIISLFRK